MKRLLLVSVFSLIASQSSHANIVGTDANNFNTITNGLDFVTVHSSETLEPGLLNMGLFGTYAKNTLAYLGESTRDGQAYSDSMLSSDVNFGLGLLRNFDVGVSFPVLLSSSDNSNADRVTLKNNGLTEVRLNAKLQFLGDKSGGMAFVASINNGLIQNNPYAGAGAGPTFNFELAADTTLGRQWALGGNIGYRARNRGRQISGFPIEPLGDQFLMSAATSYLFPGSQTKMIFELYGAVPVQKKSLNTDRAQNAAEALLGVKHDLTPRLALHGGAGTSLQKGVASPDWRVYAGLNYVFGPIWKTHKAVIQKVTPKFRYDVDDDAPVETVEPFWMATPEPEERFVMSDITFEFNSDRIVQEGSREALRQLADYAQKPPVYRTLVIEGHTDSIGGEKYNLDLSQRRANNIKRFLVESFGLDAKRIRAIGYGESRPIADNGNFQGRQRNRRVEFLVYREGSKVPEDLKGF